MRSRGCGNARSDYYSVAGGASNWQRMNAVGDGPAWQAHVDIQIPFHDVDAMGIVWHGHYLKYFEIARCALLDSIGYNYAQMAESGYAWPIIGLRVRQSQSGARTSV